MKKSLLLLLLVASLGILPAYSFQVDGIYYNILNGQANAVEVTYESYKSEFNYSGITNAIIPDSVTYQGTTYRVTSIGDFAFYDCSGLVSVSIGNNVTSIGEWTFTNCSSLASVTIPNSVTSIVNNPFSDCSGLTSMTVEAGNIVFDSRDNCNAIIKTATNTLIAGCQNTTIPNSVTSIGNYAFNGCSSMTSITIPNSVTNIGDYAFQNCSSLSSITIPSSVTNIGMRVFSDCSSLTIIEVEAGNTVFDSRDNCNAIIKTASNTLLIGFQSTNIPNSVTSIEYEAFRGCNGLSSITIPNSVTSIGDYAFYCCSNLSSVTIGNGVTSIGNQVFQYCRRLKSITIPSNVTSIGERAFSDCSGLTSVTIPDSVTSIERFAFYGCFSLTSVTIGNSVKSIGMSAFEDCGRLTSVILGNSVRSIGSFSFQSCSSLTSIILPNSVTSIGEWAFAKCGGLNSITCEALTPPTLDVKVFLDVDMSIPLYVPANSVALYQAASGWQNFTNIQAILEKIIIDSIICASDLPITWQDKTIPYAGTYYDTLQTVEGYDSVIQILNLTVHPTYLIEDIVTIREDELPYSWQNRTIAEAGNYSASYETVHGCDSTITLQLMVTALPIYTVNVVADHGYVNGTGTYPEGTQITLTAVPDDGFEFQMWSDGTTTNPKAFTVQQDTTFRAHFFMPEVEQEVTVDSIETNSVTITWDTVPGATLYELRIYKNGQLVVTYEIDANNNILNEFFNGPDRIVARKDSTGGSSETLQVNVSGLEAGQDYTYTLDALDGDLSFVGAQSGSFTTEDEPIDGLDNPYDDRRNAPRKVLRDGVIYIEMPDGTRYTPIGQKVE